MLETVLAPAAASLLRMPLPRTSQDHWTNRGNIQGQDKKSTPDSAPNFSGIIRGVRCSFVSSQDRRRTNMQSCWPPGFWSACLHEKCKPGSCLFCADFGVLADTRAWMEFGDGCTWGPKKKSVSKSVLLKGLKVPKLNYLLVILRHQQAEKGRRILHYSHWCLHCASRWKPIFSQSACSFSNVLACSGRSSTSASPTSVTHRGPTSIFQSTVSGVGAEAYKNMPAWKKETQFGHRREQTSTRLSNNDKHVWN